MFVGSMRAMNPLFFLVFFTVGGHIEGAKAVT